MRLAEKKKNRKEKKEKEKERKEKMEKLASVLPSQLFSELQVKPPDTRSSLRTTEQYKVSESRNKIEQSQDFQELGISTLQAFSRTELKTVGGKTRFPPKAAMGTASRQDPLPSVKNIGFQVQQSSAAALSAGAVAHTRVT